MSSNLDDMYDDLFIATFILGGIILTTYSILTFYVFKLTRSTLDGSAIGIIIGFFLCFIVRFSSSVVDLMFDDSEKLIGILSVVLTGSSFAI